MSINMDKCISRLEAAMRAFSGYDEKAKRELELAGRAFFKAWMTRHNLKGKITCNQGGIAVAADVGCQGEGWEASILHWGIGGEPVMFRTRTENGVYRHGRRQLPRFETGANNWFSLRRFIDITPADIGVKENS